MKHDAEASEGLVYLVGAPDSTVAKIGKSSDVRARLATLQTGSPVRLEILATVPGGFRLEAALHAHFALQRLDGEWFDFGAEDPIQAFSAAAELLGRMPELEPEEVKLKVWRDHIRWDGNLDMSKSFDYDVFCHQAHPGSPW